VARIFQFLRWAMQRSTAERIPERCLFALIWAGEVLLSVVPHRRDDGFAVIAQIGDDQVVVHVLGQHGCQASLT
jgi:hypothetical protein